ncbi:MAG: sensor histidine kinase [Bacteroidales bacterium]
MNASISEATTKLKDLKLLLIGIPVVALIGVLVLGRGFIKEHDLEIIVPVTGSVLSTVIIWLGVRRIVIYLWDKFPWEKNPVKHLLIEIAAILGYTMLAGILISLYWLYFNPEYINNQEFGLNIFFTLLVTFFITSLHEGWFFFQQWKKTLLFSEKLEKENIQIQFETLKSQISPHFLFNNLNTLTSLIEDDQKLAVDYVQRTADYFRNILSLKDKDVILLTDEMRLIEDYYYLQQKRFGSNLTLDVYVGHDYLRTFVAPLTIQMLFENAIKHNIISKESPLNISISIDEEYIIVRNNLQLRENDAESNGIGLKNIKNRYLYLSGREVIVYSNSDIFVVKLPVLRMQK